MLVPPDIVAVRRQSPPRIRKCTPWHPQPDGVVATARPGEREWFGDGVFCESRDGHARSGYGLSLLLHVCAVVPLAAFLMTRPDQLIIIALSPGLEMAAFIAPPPPVPTPAPAVSPAIVLTKASSPVPAAAPPPPPAGDLDQAPAPIDVPSGITPETGVENREGGVEGGVAKGVAGGVVGGVGTALSGPGPSGAVLRAGTDVKPPRKTKDVKPVYPAVALPTRGQGSVLIEAVIGPDGKVQSVKLLHSVPLLDQAALDAVRQWEYEPSTLNGVPVAVMMTVVVNFALQ